MKNLFLAIVLLALVFMEGCVAGQKVTYVLERREFSLDTIPPGAKIYQVNPFTKDKILLGVSPLQKQPVMVIAGAKGRTDVGSVYSITAQSDVVDVLIEKEGYVAEQRRLSTRRGEVADCSIKLRLKQ